MARRAAFRSAWLATMVLPFVLAAVAQAQVSPPVLSPPAGKGEQADFPALTPSLPAALSQPAPKPLASAATPKTDAWDGIPISCFVPDPGDAAKQLKDQRDCFLSAVRAAREARASLAFDPLPVEALLLLVLLPLVLVGVFIICVWSRDNSGWKAGAALREMSGPGTDGKPSISRMIMFGGSVVLVVYFMAFATLLLWAIGSTGRVPPLSEFGSLLMYSAPLFVPYVASQVRAGIQAIKS
jgi:hypothetical protein